MTVLYNYQLNLYKKSCMKENQRIINILTTILDILYMLILQNT